MMTINGTTYMTMDEALARVRALPLVMGERTFRARVRLSRQYIGHRNQMLMTEAHIARFLETLAPTPDQPKAPKCPSPSNGAETSGTSRVASGASVTARALALARARTPNSSE